MLQEQQQTQVVQEQRHAASRRPTARQGRGRVDAKPGVAGGGGGGGNTPLVIQVGATVATVIATNSVGNIIQVGA